MRPSRLPWLPAVIGFVLLASPASAATTWTVIPTPNPASASVSNATLASVSSSSPTDGWAVGTLEVGATEVPLAEHWNGATWTAVRTARPSGRQAWFSGVLAFAPGNVWAVGASSDPSGTTIDVRTLIEHWNGSAWSIVPSPNPATGGASGDELDAVSGSGPDDVWAVGSVHDDVQQDNVLLFAHFDGTSWKPVRTPSPPGSEHFARAIDVLSPSDAWAVGTVALEQTLAAHWDGTRWSIVQTPSPKDGRNVLNSLTGVTAVSSNDAWASGYEGNVGNQNFMKPYVLHWDGSAWTLTVTPNQGGEGSRLNAIVALSSSDVWGVGQTQGLDGNIVTFTQRFDGASWTTVPSPSPAGTNGFHTDSLDGVASFGGANLQAVGAREIAGQCCLRTLAIGTTNG